MHGLWVPDPPPLPPPCRVAGNETHYNVIKPGANILTPEVPVTLVCWNTIRQMSMIAFGRDEDIIAVLGALFQMSDWTLMTKPRTAKKCRSAFILRELLLVRRYA